MQPGLRNWIKTKSRAAQEIVVGGVIGSIDRPEVVIAGLYRADGTFVNVGRTVPLRAAQSRALADVLRPAGAEHPWPDLIGASRFGRGRDQVSLTKVEPTVVAEVAADTGLQAGRGAIRCNGSAYEQTYGHPTCPSCRTRTTEIPAAEHYPPPLQLV